jgi:CBS domain-containing protein
VDKPILPGDEAYDDALDAGAAGRRRVIDQATFQQPIRTVGMRRSVMLEEGRSVADAIEAMRLARIGSVLVTSADKMLVGIVTERDILNRVALGEVDPRTTPIHRVMKTHVDTLTPDDAIAYALRIMSHGGYRHVPLVDRAGRAVGVISVRDIVDFVADLFPDDILTLPSNPRRNIAKTPEGA